MGRRGAAFLNLGEAHPGLFPQGLDLSAALTLGSQWPGATQMGPSPAAPQFTLGYSLGSHC